MENTGNNNKISVWNNWGIILSVYIALKPIYLNASGSLQISDMFLAAAFLYILVRSKARITFHTQNKPIIITMLFFVLHVCVVNGLWSTTGYDYSRYSLYYIFNFLAVLICVLVYDKIGKENYNKALINGAFFSALITSISLIQTIGTYGARRGLGFFNNPNQLGYYGVVLVSVVFFCKKNKYELKHYVILIIGFWSIVSSLSKAAFISAFIECFICTIFLERDKSMKVLSRRFLLIVVIAALVYLFLYTDFMQRYPALGSLARMRRRLFNMANENDTSLGIGRGYDRILEMGNHFLWGMGEGNFTRFEVMKGAEVHSTYATVIVSYGALGMLFYGLFMLTTLIKRNSTLRNLAIVSGVLLYSISHNGVRNTLVWILFASIFLKSLPDDYLTDKRTIKGLNEAGGITDGIRN